jgi:MmyB-like transcription regulator ligand binding domain
MNVAAIVQNAHQDIVASNELGRALYSPHYDTDGRPNIARFIFLDSRAQQYYVDWLLARRTIAAMLRREAGRNPLDAELTALIGELSTRSAVFREDWARHDVRVHRTGPKQIHHPDVGVIDITYDVFEMPGEPGLSIVTYSVEPNTPSADRLALLASLNASGTAAADADGAELPS